MPATKEVARKSPIPRRIKNKLDAAFASWELHCRSVNGPEGFRANQKKIRLNKSQVVGFIENLMTPDSD